MNPSDGFSRLRARKKTGQEPIAGSNCNLLSFWRWAFSDLLGNITRGKLAEFLVALDIGVADGVREEWDSFDLTTPEGIKVEVKSSAYLQSWGQNRLSSIVFGIGPTLTWDADTGATGGERKRQADVYVLCVLDHRQKRTVDPLDTKHWSFYVLRSCVLDQECGQQKTMTLLRLLELNPLKVEFGGIGLAIRRVWLTDADEPPAQGSGFPPAGGA